MALYAYFCSNCNMEYEFDYSMGEAPDAVECPVCRALIRRMFLPSPRVWADGAPC